MLDQDGQENLWGDLNRRWVLPEIDRRRALGTLPQDFKIWKCLIRLPKDAPPIVEFNDEIQWRMRVKKPKGIAFAAGDPVYFSQIEGVDAVVHPNIDGKKVAFFYIHKTPDGWQIVFSAVPNLPQFNGESADIWDFSLSGEIAESMNAEFREVAVHQHDHRSVEIRSIGLWLAPALLPYPMSAILEHCRAGHPEEARLLLAVHFDTSRLRQMAIEWRSVAAFADRMQIVDEALFSHEHSKFTQSISTLIPHIEGIVTDWAYPNGGTVPQNQRTKFDRFRDQLSLSAIHAFTDRRVAESVVDFIMNGPLMVRFENWLLPASDSFPSRHVLGHGKVDPRVFTTENSIKVFLMLDTLHWIMKRHDDGTQTVATDLATPEAQTVQTLPAGSAP